MTRQREVYEKMCAHYNRLSSEQKVCECGKIIRKNTYEKHLQSKTHIYLLYHKKRAEESEKENTQPQNEKPTAISTWNKICQMNTLNPTPTSTD